ncbi:hypothetical protein Tco_0375540 [Tanacetum coccineum]
MNAKLAWIHEKYNHRSETHIGGSSSQTHEIGDVYLTAEELHQLHLDEEALRETLEEQTMDEKAREEKIRQKQADDDEYFMEFGVMRIDSDYDSEESDTASIGHLSDGEKEVLEVRTKKVDDFDDNKDPKTNDQDKLGDHWYAPKNKATKMFDENSLTSIFSWLSEDDFDDNKYPKTNDQDKLGDHWGLQLTGLPCDHGFAAIYLLHRDHKELSRKGQVNHCRTRSASGVNTHTMCARGGTRSPSGVNTPTMSASGINTPTISASGISTPTLSARGETRSSKGSKTSNVCNTLKICHSENVTEGITS